MRDVRGRPVVRKVVRPAPLVAGSAPSVSRTGVTPPLNVTRPDPRADRRRRRTMHRWPTRGCDVQRLAFVQSHTPCIAFVRSRRTVLSPHRPRWRATSNGIRSPGCAPTRTRRARRQTRVASPRSIVVSDGPPHRRAAFGPVQPCFNVGALAPPATRSADVARRSRSRLCEMHRAPESRARPPVADRCRGCGRSTRDSRR